MYLHHWPGQGGSHCKTVPHKFLFIAVINSANCTYNVDKE